MERDKIIFFRNFFYAAFVIGLIFVLCYFAATLLFWNTATSWATRFFKNEKEFGNLVLLFFIQLRIVVVFFFLVRRWPCIEWRERNN